MSFQAVSGGKKGIIKFLSDRKKSIIFSKKAKYCIVLNSKVNLTHEISCIGTDSGLNTILLVFIAMSFIWQFLIMYFKKKQECNIKKQLG